MAVDGKKAINMNFTLALSARLRRFLLECDTAVEIVKVGVLCNFLYFCHYFLYAQVLIDLFLNPRKIAIWSFLK